MKLTNKTTIAWPKLAFIPAIAVLMSLCSGIALSQTDTTTTDDNDSPLNKIITPDIERRTITEDQLDSENWEVGIYGGIFSIEDFGSSPVVGARVAYHLTEDFALELNYGVTEAGDTSFETLAGDVQVLAGDNRDYTYYNISVIYNILPGEVFIGKNTAFNTSFYILAGAGNTTFNENDYFTYSFGAGLRFYLTDSFAIHATFKDHVFENDVIETKNTNNLEGTIGLSLYF